MGHFAQSAGAAYERTVSSVCLHYMAAMLATVSKVPTEKRAGKYATASTVDFEGYRSGSTHIAFEVKGSKLPHLELTRPPRKKGEDRRPTLEAHQLTYLDYAALDGCIAGVLVCVTVGRDTEGEHELWWWITPKAWMEMVAAAKAVDTWKHPRATQAQLNQYGWKCPMVQVPDKRGYKLAPDWLTAALMGGELLTPSRLVNS